MTEYNKMAKGSFTAASGQTTAVINLPFQPDRVELWNYTNIKASPADNLFLRAYWFSNLIDGANNPTMIEAYGAAGALAYDTIATNGISTFNAGLALQYGPTKQVIGITKAALARVNVTAHGYNVGDTVTFQGLATGVTNNAMRLLNNVPFTIEAVSDADHFDIQWNTSQSSYTALSASPTGALVKKVLYPFLYVPQDNVVSAVTTGATTTVITTMYHNFEIGQEIAFRVTPFWGMIQLNSLPNVVIPGSPVYGYVTSITDNWTFVCSINSTAFTAFTTNQTVIPTNVTMAQVLAVGDVNTGGNIITATSPLYPSPQFPTSTNRVPTINGPAIRGAFVNNTSQGFIIGAGAATTDTTTVILTPSQANVIAWVAYYDDIQMP